MWVFLANSHATTTANDDLANKPYFLFVFISQPGRSPKTS